MSLSRPTLCLSHSLDLSGKFLTLLLDCCSLQVVLQPQTNCTSCLPWLFCHSYHNFFMGMPAYVLYSNQPPLAAELLVFTAQPTQAEPTTQRELGGGVMEAAPG